MTNSKKLPKALTDLVKKSVNLLGEVILEEAGEQAYQVVESIRQEMVTYRGSSENKRNELLESLYSELKGANPKLRHQVAQSFTLMLELVNACETSYRTFRLQESGDALKLKKQDNSLVFVLTAHPTEARTSKNIDLFQRIQDLAVRLLKNTGEDEYLLSIIKHNLKLLWLLPVTLHEKPMVVDEANHIFSIILRPDILDTILRADRDLGRVRVRTWVGGDKDGHPGVDEKVMLACLQSSRTHFVKAVNRMLEQFFVDSEYLDSPKIQELNKKLKMSIKQVHKVQKDDHLNMKSFHSSLDQIRKHYQKTVGSESPRLSKICSLLKLFPALVIPLELREDSELIDKALKSSKPEAIERMLNKLKEVSGGRNLPNYAQGMIISMCESFQDISNTMKLLKRAVGSYPIPVIPLFETQSALNNSSKIIKEALADKTYLNQIVNTWDSYLEIMLGYSDSSKGMGVIASRIGIARTMRSLDQLIKKNKIQPVFFHGSGGSVDRGGGSLKEQTAWWPKSALQTYKATIQGEMVERTFSTSEIALSSMNKIRTNFNKVKSREGDVKIDKVVEDFANSVSEKYQETINDEAFFKMVSVATPYSYLSALKLGSRPTKRAKAATLDFSSIRAIPWVLCWTQTRLLLPTWLGVGHTWKKYKRDIKTSGKLKRAYQTSHIFSSYVRVLGFTLSKVDMSVFKLYLNHSKLTKKEQEEAYSKFKKEFQQACDFVAFLTETSNLLWFRPWLKESIQLRSSMIHPLNVLQIIARENSDLELIRKTTAGISSGMMTTG